MFSHTETFILFALAAGQGGLIASMIKRSAGWPVVLALPCGWVLGFILACIEFTVFSRVFKKRK